MNILKLVTPLAMHASISLSVVSLTSETIMWKP